jgi:hypothetical protein
MQIKIILVHSFCHIQILPFLPHHVVSQTREERLFDEIGVVLFENLLIGLLGLHGSQFVSLGFESANDVTDDSTLDSIGFDLNIGTGKKSLALASHCD